jgi:acetyltransferase
MTSRQESNFDLSSLIKKYSTQQTLKNGEKVFFRPIEPKDQSKLSDFFKTLSMESIHYRFFEIMKELSIETLQKTCNLDYSKEIAIVAEPENKNKIIAVARLIISKDKNSGELTLVVTDEYQGLGLGMSLLKYCIQIAKDYKLEEARILVTDDNKKMIRLAKKIHFKESSRRESIVEMKLSL